MLHSIIKNTIKDNKLFILLCLTWFIIGGIMLSFLTRNQLFFPINQYYNFFLNYFYTLMSVLGRGDFIAIFLLALLLFPSFKKNKIYISTALIFGVLIPTIIFFTKIYFNKPRPISFYGMRQVHTVPWLDNLLNNSFPSGHTLGAFGFFTILAFFIPAKYKNYTLFFFLLALLCGISRIYLGQHFFQDIYAGSILGFVLTFIIYICTTWFFTKKEKTI